MSELTIPTFEQMMNPVFQALRELGGSGTIDEINTQVAAILGLRDDQLEVIHDPQRGARTEIEYRLAWSRTYLKKFGVLDNSSQGVWAITPSGQDIENIDEKQVVRFVREKAKAAKPTQSIDEQDDDVDEIVSPTWQDELLTILTHMNPAAFERLFQRILRESGFTRVEVLGRSGDGGIDGLGIIRIGGFLSFMVLFQCKRWTSSVGSSVVRDLRGAMSGRADKGLLATTSTFTNDARQEATRDGATAIDLVDGQDLLAKLKELGLGVKTEHVVSERVTIDQEFFSNI